MTTELAVKMEMFIFAIQYSGHQPRLAFEHLKWDECDSGTEF